MNLLKSRSLPRRACRTGLWLLLLWLLLGAVAEAAQVTYLVRPAQVRRHGAREWITLNLGDEVREGDAVRTGTGARVELSITPKRQFRIGQATEIVLEGLVGELEEQQGLKAKVKLLLGRFWGSLREPLNQTFGERVEVATATATIGVKGTTFGVDFEKKEKATQVAVVTGQVAVQPPPTEVGPPTEVAGPREIAPPQEISRDEWTRLVAANQKLIVRPGEVPTTAPLTDEDKKDEWIAFNIARDQQQ